MAGHAKPRVPSKRAWRLAIVRSTFHDELTRAMLEDARRRAVELGCRVVAEAEVAGSYDVPFVMRSALARPNVDAGVALGVIVKGGTLHDEHIAHAAFYALTQVALEAKKPVGLGITGPGQTFDQAKARIDRAGAAVDAVVSQLEAVRTLRSRT